MSLPASKEVVCNNARAVISALASRIQVMRRVEKMRRMLFMRRVFSMHAQLSMCLQIIANRLRREIVSRLIPVRIGIVIQLAMLDALFPEGGG